MNIFQYFDLLLSSRRIGHTHHFKFSFFLFFFSWFPFLVLGISNTGSRFCLFSLQKQNKTSPTPIITEGCKLGKSESLSMCSGVGKTDIIGSRVLDILLQHVSSFQRGFFSPASSDASLLQHVLLSFLVALGDRHAGLEGAFTIFAFFNQIK